MSKTKRHTEPLMHITKRPAIALWKNLSIRGIGLVLALIVCAIVIYAVTKLNPLAVYVAMFKGTFGSQTRVWYMLRDTAMLLCIAVGLAPAFKMRFWNIGAEGQVLMGAVAAAACMKYVAPNVPLGLSLVIMFAASAIAGGIWGFIPSVFKARWNTNETLFTLMMNYIAIQITSFCVSKWEDHYGSNTVGVINQQTHAGWFPPILGQQYLLNVLIVAVITVCMYLYLKESKHGFEIAVVGESTNTARYAAMNVRKIIIRTVIVSGAICGIAGFIAVAGAGHTISTSTAGGRGFTAIIVAWLSKFNTFIMTGVSALIVFLQKGAIQIASQFGLNDFVSEMITGIILFFILGSEFFINFKVRFRSSRKEIEK